MNNGLNISTLKNLNKMSVNEIRIKPCYRCRERKPTSEMEEIGMWVCKSCLNELSKSKKNKRK